MACKRLRTPWYRHGIAVIAAAALCGLGEVRNGINDIRFRRSVNAVDAPWGRGRDTVTFLYTPLGLSANATAYSGVLAAIICVPAACPLRPHGALGDLNALLLHRRCEPMAFLLRSIRSPWHGVLGDPTASSGDATAMPRRSLGALGDPNAGTSAFWVFLARRAVAVRTPPWCDRDLNGAPGGHWPSTRVRRSDVASSRL